MKSNTQTLPGDNKKYAVAESAVRYTLRDNAFIETRNGNFQFERTLSKQPMDKKSPKLKITISKDLSELTISTVVANGMKKIDLFKNDERQESREFAIYVLDDLVANGVLEIVK